MGTEEFYQAFASYNSTWLPVLGIIWVLLLISTVLVFVRPNRQTNSLIKALIAVSFLWSGVVFFPLYMTVVALPGAVTSLAIGILFAIDAFRNRIAIHLPEGGWLRYVTIILVVWALGVYTLTGYAIGHPYPQGPLPVAPCPLTILSIALISTYMDTLQKDRWPFTLLFVLLIWWGFFSGLGASFLYGFYTDLTLFLAGLYGLFMLARHWKAAKPAR